MILHIATFRWNDDVTDADVEALTAALMEMAAGIPELKSYTAGANLHLRPAGVDYGVVALVDDAAGLEAEDFGRGAWPVVATIPMIGLPVGFLLIFVLLIMSIIRKGRATGPRS